MSRIFPDRFRHKDNKLELQASDLRFLRSPEVEKDFQKLYHFSQTLINAIPYGVGVIDEHGNILFLSEQLASLFKENATGQPTTLPLLPSSSTYPWFTSLCQA